MRHNEPRHNRYEQRGAQNYAAPVYDVKSNIVSAQLHSGRQPMPTSPPQSVLLPAVCIRIIIRSSSMSVDTTRAAGVGYIYAYRTEPTPQNAARFARI